MKIILLLLEIETSVNEHFSKDSFKDYQIPLINWPLFFCHNDQINKD